MNLPALVYGAQNEKICGETQASCFNYYEFIAIVDGTLKT